MKAHLKKIILVFSSLFLSTTVFAQSELGGTPPSANQQSSSMFYAGDDFTNILIDFAVIAGLYAAGKNMPKDKRMHLYAGAITGRVASIWCGMKNKHKPITERRKRQFLCSFGAATAAGILKEVYDGVSGKGQVEFKDAVVTGVGGTLMGIRYL